MKAPLAWIVFVLAAMACLLWIGLDVRGSLQEEHVFRHVIQERESLAGARSSEILIGVVGDWKEDGDILRGVRLAAEDINRDGGILGRQVVLEVRDDHGTENGALAAAQEFVSRPDIPFVIGHTRQQLNAAAAQNYEFYGVLAISPNTSGLGRDASALALFFENGPPALQIGNAILALAEEKGWKRMGVVYDENHVSSRRSRIFEGMAIAKGIQAPLSFEIGKDGFEGIPQIERWKRELGLDAIVLAVRRDDVATQVSAFRAAGLDCPVVVVGEESEAIGRAQDGSLGALYFLEPFQDDDAHALFARDYAARFNVRPTLEAVQGYDTLALYAQGVRKAGTFVPAEVAKALKTDEVSSLSGTLRFDDRGGAVKRHPRFVQKGSP